MKTLRPLRYLVAVSCVTALFAAGGVTPAVAGGHPPHTDPIAGTFTFTTVQVKQRTCAGQDGPYLDLDVTQVGTATGDARISGHLGLTSRVLLNAATGLGTSEGRFTVRDAATDRKKAAGEFHGVITPGAPGTFALQGLLLGDVFAEGAGSEDQVGSGRVLANFDAVFDAQLNGTGDFGGVGSGLNPAVIQGGRCGGPVTRIP